jgi:hypothetical protein
MNLQPLSENNLPQYVAFQFPQIGVEERQSKIKKISENLKSGRLIPEQYLLFVDDHEICGLLRWRYQDRDSQQMLETLGTPSITPDSRKPEAIQLALETLAGIADRESLRLKLTLDEAQFGSICDDLISKFRLTLTFQSRGYGRDLTNLKPRESALSLQPIGVEKRDLQTAAGVLATVQAHSLDPTASEDLDDPLAVLEERIANGERLASIGGASENYLAFYEMTPVGLLMPSHTHPLEKRGGMFLGLVPQARGRGLGLELHYQGLLKLQAMGAEHYRGETFEGNTPMKRIFFANGCTVIPGSNYWEYTSQ